MGGGSPRRGLTRRVLCVSIAASEESKAASLKCTAEDQAFWAREFVRHMCVHTYAKRRVCNMCACPRPGARSSWTPRCLSLCVPHRASRSGCVALAAHCCAPVCVLRRAGQRPSDHQLLHEDVRDLPGVMLPDLQPAAPSVQRVRVAADAADLPVPWHVHPTAAGEARHEPR